VRVDRSRLLTSIRQLEAWLDAHDWRGYEPHDGLNTPVRRLLGQRRLALLALKQVVLKSPWNLRPVLGIPRETSPEARGFFARGYLRLHAALGTDADRGRAIGQLDWLAAHPEAGYHGACWGNQFDYVTRFFYLPKGTPIVVWTAHNAHVFVDAADLLKEDRYLRVARSAAEFVLTDLPRRPERHGISISYVPGGHYPVHNASLLGASLLARVGARTAEQPLLDVAEQAVVYTVKHQRDDGSWWYGEAENLRWVDNFHTGYVLECLWVYRNATGDDRFDGAIRKGLDYYVETFFLPDGTPKYFSTATYPLDIQCAAQSIETLNELGALRDGTRELAARVAGWTLDNLRDPSGYFLFRRGPRWTSRTPMLHWGQATMFSAMAGLLAGQGS
jgi:hypothetical protein